MCKFNIPYAEAVRTGKVNVDEIDDYIEYWHRHNIGDSLHDFLCMTKDEYIAWIKRGNMALPEILGIDYEIPTCKVCGCEMGIKTAIGIIVSSCYNGTDICRDCQVEHCLSTNCLACNIGKYPDCKHLRLKEHYVCMEEARLEVEEEGKANEG